MEFLTENLLFVILIGLGVVAGIAMYWKPILAMFPKSKAIETPVIRAGENDHRTVTNRIIDNMYFARSIGNKELEESNYKALKKHFDDQGAEDVPTA